MLPALFTLGVFFLSLLFMLGVGLLVANSYVIVSNALEDGMPYVGVFLGVAAVLLSFAPLFLYSLLIFVDSW